MVDIFIHMVLGGCFVEGEWLRNAFRWKETVGPWEERPGHFGDVWMYWTDDGLGHFEFLQVGVVSFCAFWILLEFFETRSLSFFLYFS